MTAWRMNEWHVIRFYWRHRLTGANLVVLATIAATVTLHLTQAIIAGVGLSLLLFLSQVSRLDVVPTRVDPERLRAAGHDVPDEASDTQVMYVSGALFFGAVNQFTEAMERVAPSRALILSMRGVPMVDVSSVHAFEHLWQAQRTRGGELFVTGLQPHVRRLFERAGLVRLIGPDRFFWSADQAILRAVGSGSDAVPGRPGDDRLGKRARSETNELPFGVVAGA